jgi:thiol-disulfide isomerase/thioredoxin
MKVRRLLVSLIGKRYCGLCDEAEHQILKVKEQIPFEFEKIDIEKRENKEFLLKYVYEIPVVHLNGKEVMRNAVDSEFLKKVLKFESNRQQE